jgi:hypothetical protein
VEPNFAKNQVSLIMAQMVYTEVVLGVLVDLKIVLGSQGGNVHAYQPCIFVMETNPSAPLKNPPTPTTIPLVRKTQLQFPPTFSLVISPIIFQPVPPIPIVPQLTTLSSYFTQDPSSGISGRIVQHPWEQNPLQSTLNMDDPWMENNWML